jgi:hypothetical protein
VEEIAGMQSEGSCHDPGRQDDSGLPREQTRADSKEAFRCREREAVKRGRGGLAFGKSGSKLALAALVIATMFSLMQGEAFEALFFWFERCAPSAKNLWREGCCFENL